MGTLKTRLVLRIDTALKRDIYRAARLDRRTPSNWVRLTLASAAAAVLGGLPNAPRTNRSAARTPAAAGADAA